MNLISIRLFQQRWPIVMTGALLLMFCWLLAQWTWLIILPNKKLGDSAGSTMLDAHAVAESVVSQHLFGRSAESRMVITSSVQSVSNIKLQGVFAAVGSLPAFAILSVDGKSGQAVQAGKEFASSVILEEVHPDYVLIRQQGVSVRLNLEKRATVPIGTANAGGFKLEVQSKGGDSFTFSRGELNQALQDSKQLANLGRLTPYPAGGMLVEEVPAGSLAVKLGLQMGDILQHFNGRPVKNNQDVQLFFQEMQHVAYARLDGMRGGQPLKLEYKIQP